MEDHVNGVGQAEVGLLHDELGEGPADAGKEAGREHHDEANGGDVGGLVCEHAEARGDHQDNKDQGPMLQA